MEDRIRVTGDTDMLVREIVERNAVEVSAALAAIRLVRSVSGPKTRSHLLNQASVRMGGLAAIYRYLALSFDGPIDVAQALEAIVQAIAAGLSRRPGRVLLNLQSMRIAPAQARSLLLIAYELVSARVREVIEVHGGDLSVSLIRHGDYLSLELSEDGGPELQAVAIASCIGFKSRLVADLVRDAAGFFECAAGTVGIAYRILLPTSVPVRFEG